MVITVATAELYDHIWPSTTAEQYAGLRALFPKFLNAVGFDLNWFKGKTCLDIGCGTGRLAASLIDCGAESAYGCDIAEGALAVGRKYAPEVKFSFGNALHLPYSNSMFDFVAASGVLHHTEDPLGGLKEIARVLKPDGLVYTLLYSKSFRWEVFEQIRPCVQGIGRKRFSDGLAKLGCRENKYWLDCLFTPINETYHDHDIDRMFDEAGFVIEERWNSLAFDSIPRWGDAYSDFLILASALNALDDQKEVTETALRCLTEALAVLGVLDKALPKPILERFLFGSANHRTLARRRRVK